MLHPSTHLKTIPYKVMLIPPLVKPKLNNLPVILDEYNLCNNLGYNGKYPWFVIRDSSACYKKFWIDKETKKFCKEFNPDLNLREINAPTAALKTLQGRLAAYIFNKLPKHPANYAYMSGKNVRDAASIHEDSAVLVRIDMKNFFTMHNELYVRNKLHEITGYAMELCWFISHLCSLNGTLPQGSATSPILSIVLNYDMDERLTAIASKYKMTYTRYADDLCFSGSNTSNNTIWDMIREVSEATHPFKVNWKKVDIMRNKAYRYINGFSIKHFDKDNKQIIKDLLDTEFKDFDVKFSSTKITCTQNKEFKLEELEIIGAYIKSKISSIDICAHYFYVQSIQRMLGMNLTDGIKYPRAKYLDLRLNAFLLAKGCKTINRAQFNGRLNFMRLIDPNKASKIDKILNKQLKGDS